MMYVLITMARLLLSLPMVVLWIGIYLLLCVGWGVPKADQFLLHWNKFVGEEDVDIVRKANEANG